MKTLAPSLAFALFAALLLPAAQSGLRREGDYWVETTAGDQVIENLDQVRIVSAGNITVHGGVRDRISYTITRRIHTRDEAAAREALEQGGLNITRQGRGVHLIVGSPNGPVDFQVVVPRGLSRVLAGTQPGNISISDLDGGVAVESGGGVIQLNRIKGSAEINSVGNKLDIGEILGSVRASLAGGDIVAKLIGGAARLETAGGNINVQKIGGSAQAITAGGSVHIGQAGGAVAVSNGGGLIDIGSAGGVITLNNAGGGPVRVGAAPFGVQCSNASGGIQVRGIDGAVHLSTATGSLLAELQSKLLRESWLTTGAGDITVFIPSNLGVTIAAENSGAGRLKSIVSDFPGIQVRLNGITAVARGSINGGGPILHISGNGGVIWIKRK